ncbi:MAG: MATE family efflux transporter, partial [Eubacterium sp.]|nr:MATE family efflux transporter [Eubacterium sp.]
MKKLNSTFLDGPILPALLRFSIPVLCALLLQALYGAVDLWAVGTFCGEADVSAVATGSQTMLIVTGIVTGLSMGTTVLLGKKIGSGDRKGAADTIGTSICVFTLLGIVLSIVMIFAASKIAVIMNAPQEAFEKTVHYILICGAGSLFIVGYNLISAIFRGMGNSKAPLLFVSIACAANIVGDIILIEVFHMGTAGAAIATIAAQGISVILSLLLIRKKGLPFPFGKENMGLNKGIAATIMKLGFPIALQDMCNEISYLIIIGLVNALGVTASAGVGIAEKLVMFMLLIPMSYMQSISAFVAQNIGAGQEARAQKAMWTGMFTAVILGGAMSWLSFFHGDLLSRIFIKELPVINASAVFLKATAIECFILSIAYCFTGYYNGLGKTTFVMAQGLCAIFLVKIPYAWFASSRPEPSLFQIGMSTAYAAAFTLIV